MHFGRYELVTRLGSGGMAEVFLARQTGPAGFEKLVAVKRILPHLAASPECVQMFLDEARLVARLDHPHITHIYDFGEEGGQYYLAMEYVAGEDLLTLYRRASERRLKAPPHAVATLLWAACDALHYAHSMQAADGRPLGIVHRDITPGNLLVAYDGTVKVADFGIAKAEVRVSHTHAGALKGKYAYMAPEQALGQRVDARADVFSLGVCAWEMLTGERLFYRDSEPAMIRAITEEDAPRLDQLRPDAPRRLTGVIARALARDPAMRFATAQEMQLAIEQALLANRATPSKAALARWVADVLGGEHIRRRRALARGAVVAAVESTQTLAPGEVIARAMKTPVALRGARLGARIAQAAWVSLALPRLGRRSPASSPPRPLSKRSRVMLAALLTVVAMLVALALHMDQSRRAQAAPTPGAVAPLSKTPSAR